MKKKFDQDLCLNLWYDPLGYFGRMNSTLGSVVPLAMFCYIYSRAALGAFVEVKVHVMARRLLRSVRHRTLKPPSYVLHVILSSLLFILGTCASFQEQEPRPSLESSNHSSLDLVSASIGEPEPGFDEVLFSVLVLCIQVFLTVMWGGTLHRYKGQTMCKTRFESQEMTLNGFWKIMLI